MAKALPPVRSFISRWEFILSKCRSRRVLHLGFVGMTDLSVDAKLRAAKHGLILHHDLLQVASAVYGIDLDEVAVEKLRQDPGWPNLHVGNAERLSAVKLPVKFDVIVVGDLIEHLSNPGLMLDELHNLVHPTGEVIITTPNAFGFFSNLRVSFGRFFEGDQHVLCFNAATLAQLLERHGWHMRELYTAYNVPPRTAIQRIKVVLGSLVLRLFPGRGGTIVAVATPRSQVTQT